jgi:predicted metal-dependent RNase
MKITVPGAGGGEVTGSACRVETGSANVLVDCGFLQGAKELETSNRIPVKGSMSRLDAVVLTHGEDKPRRELSGIIADRYQLKAECPGLGDVIQL